jgi:hypothetical protein
MKIIAILILTNFFSATLTAQSNLTVFNNGGQKFYLILNGIKQNAQAQTNVVVSGIKNGGYATKVIFEDGKTNDIDKNFFIEEASDITTRIVFKKGKGKLQLVSMVAATGRVTSGAVTYRPDNNASYSDGSVGIGFVSNSTTNQSGNGSVSIQVNPNTTNDNGNGVSRTNPNNTSTTVTTTTTNTSSNSSTGNVNTNGTGNGNANGGVSISVTDPISGQNLNMNVGININEGTNNSQQNNASTTLTNTTTTNTITNTNVSTTNSSELTPQSANNDCNKTVQNSAAFIADIASQSFEDDRLEALQLALANTCLYSTDAEKIMDLFTFDANQLAAAKVMSDRLVDKENASLLAKHMTFDATKMEYRKYISGKN